MSSEMCTFCSLFLWQTVNLEKFKSFRYAGSHAVELVWIIWLLHIFWGVLQEYSISMLFNFFVHDLYMLMIISTILKYNIYNGQILVNETSYTQYVLLGLLKMAM